MEEEYKGELSALIDEVLDEELFASWLNGYRMGLTGRVYDFKTDKRVVTDSIVQETKNMILKPILEMLLNKVKERNRVEEISISRMSNVV